MSRLSIVPRPRVRRVRTLTLLESGRTVSRGHLLQTAVGMLLHGTVIVSGASLAARVPWRAEPGEVTDERAPLFLAPERKDVSATPQERLQFLGLAAGEVPAEATESAPTGTAGGPARIEGEAEAVTPVPEDEPVYDEFVLSEIDVDSAVTTDPESGGPEYPPELLAQGIEGVVAARFVVDSTGRIRPGSFSAFESTHPLFTKAVEEALPRMKFRPAYVGTKRVQQLVVQSFAFRIARGDTLLRRDTVPGGEGLEDQLSTRTNQP